MDTNGGYTLIPELAVSSAQGQQNVRLKEFERPIPSRQVGLLYRRHQYKLPLIEALGENIIASLPEKIRKLRPKDLEILEVN